MRNFTARGELKVKSTSEDTAAQQSRILAAGYINPLMVDPDGIALLQALSVLEDLDGIATAQAPSNGVPLTLQPVAASLIPPRLITLTSIADLSAINFAIVGPNGGESLAGPAGAPLDQDGIALSQAPTASTPLTLEAAAADLDPPRQLTFTSAANLSGVNFEIVGFDEDGAPQTVPAFAGPNATTVTTTELWSEVTSITPDATDAGTLEVGWPDTAATVESLLAYVAVTSITPDGTDAGNVEAGWPDSTSPFALTLALSSLSPARRITLTSTDNLSALQFALSGTDDNGVSIGEEVTGPNNSTVTSTLRYASIDAIVPLSLGSGNLSAGWPDEAFRMFIASEPTLLSHLIVRNNDPVLQTVDFTLVVEGVPIPWFIFDLSEDEVANLQLGDLPIDAGTEMHVETNTPQVVSFTLHGAG